MALDATFERVCPAAEIAPGSVAAYEVQGTPVAVVHCEDGSYHAVQDDCSHQDIPLSEGEVDGCTLECWLHGFAVRPAHRSADRAARHRADPRLPS
jgi:nitrite reductase/ring-hydroxylating ferredoxin subunit